MSAHIILSLFVLSSLLHAVNLPGWREDSTVCFSGSAETKDELYEMIDGGATLYINNGFKSARFTGLSDGHHKICFESFVLKDNKSARAVMSAVDANSGFYLAGVGDTARMDTTLYADAVLEMVTGSRFLRFTSLNARDSAALSALKMLGVLNLSLIHI